MKKLLFIIFLLGTNLAVFAQFQTGINSSNYAGVMGITINPSYTNYLNNGTDFMLFNGSVTAINNGLYMNRKPITRLLSADVLSAFTDKETAKKESMTETFDRVFDVKRDLKAKNYIFADVTMYGPSFLINYRKHSFGLLTSFKANSSSVNLPGEIITFLLKGVGAADIQGKTVKLNTMTSGSLVYTDIGLNYSYEITNNFKSTSRLGITAHYLNGINSLIFEDMGKTTWNFIGDSTILTTSGNFRYNYAATKSAVYSELLESRGKGFAFDLGYSYTRKKKGRPTRITVCPNIRYGGKIREYQEYKWKLGVALMDIGYIKFDNQAVSNSYENVNGPVRNLDLAFYGGLFSLDRALRFNFNGTPNVIYKTDNSFTHFTPMRLNAQFDYYYSNHLFFNVSASQRINPPSIHSMHYPNIISASVRYEELRYEIGLPISLIEYQYPVVGLNFRIGPFYMGTNHLPEIIGLKKIKGVDVYMGLKINLSNFRGV